MNKKYIIIAAVAALAAGGTLGTYCMSQSTDGAPVAAPTEKPTTPVSAEQAKTAFSFLVGYRFGQEISQGASTLTADDIDKEVFFKALGEALAGDKPSMSEDEIRNGMQAFAETIQAREKALAELNAQKGKAFQAEFAKQEGVTKLDSGVMYRVITKGDGKVYNEKEDGNDAIATVTYEGKLTDGKVFDKSEEPVPMPINGVVPGFSEALKLMPVGSTWEVCIPADQAYGDTSNGPIGANSTLVFTVSLQGIEKQEAPKGGAPMGLTPEMIKQLQAQGLEVMDDDAPDAPAPTDGAMPAPAPEGAPAPAAAPDAE